MPGPEGSCHHLLSVTQCHYRWPTDLLCLSHTPRCSGPQRRAVRPQERRVGLPPGSAQAALSKPGTQGQGGGLVHALPSGPLPGLGASCSGCGGWAAWERKLPPVRTLPLDLSPGLGKDQQDSSGQDRRATPVTGPSDRNRSAKRPWPPARAETFGSLCRGCRGLGPQAWQPHAPLQCGHTASGRPEERGWSGTGEQRRGVSGAGVACAGPSGCLPIWKQYRVMQAGQAGLGSGYVNSTARNMDLMGNRTSSQENPDSSPGLHPALGSPGAPPSQGPAAPWPRLPGPG